MVQREGAAILGDVALIIGNPNTDRDREAIGIGKAVSGRRRSLDAVRHACSERAEVDLAKQTPGCLRQLVTSRDLLEVGLVRLHPGRGFQHIPVMLRPVGGDVAADREPRRLLRVDDVEPRRRIDRRLGGDLP